MRHSLSRLLEDERDRKKNAPAQRFSLAGMSCAQELPKAEFFSLDFGWRPDASASRTIILARSKRDLTAVPTNNPVGGLKSCCDTEANN